MSETSTKAPAKGKKDNEKAARRQIARDIGRAVWLRHYRVANPEADRAQVKEAWLAVRKEQISAGMRALKVLEKSGYTITGGPGTAKRA